MINGGSNGCKNQQYHTTKMSSYIQMDIRFDFYKHRNPTEPKEKVELMVY